MKKQILFSIFLISALSFKATAQDKDYTEQYGHTLNVGVGIGGYAGYYGYIGRTLPVFHIDYELSVAKSFTLAPFVNFYSYTEEYYWGNKNYPYQYYAYHETVIPIGVKGTYYFDNLLHAGSDWDFYLAGSLGFAIVSSSWEDGYYGDRHYYHDPSPLFLDLHIGTEYHISHKVGVFLDLSTGVSTIGLAIH